MKKTIFGLSFILIIICSCSKINKEKLSVIENITLGRDSKTFNKQFDSLQIPHARFFNKIMLRSFDDLINETHYYNTYYTNIFNYGEYSDKPCSLQHLGLITPITLEGTHKNLGIVVLLCHTVEPWLIGEAENLKNKVSEKYIRQDVNEEIINKIKEMYVEKYGNPKSIDTSSYNSFYTINGNSIKLSTDDTRSAITLKWETEYYDVTFFTGLDLNAIYSRDNGYFESTNTIFANLDEKKADPNKNEIKCKSLPYIYYELNEKGLEELKIDNKKI